MRPTIIETAAPAPYEAFLRYARLPAGDEGIDHTAAAMLAVIHDAIEHVEPGTLLQAIADAIAEQRQNAIRMLWLWMRTSTTFRADPPGAELIRSLDQILEPIARGDRAAIDCDESSVLACAVMGCAGIPCGFAVLAREGEHAFSHVLPTWIEGTGEHVPIDAQEGFSPGIWPPHARRRLYVAVSDEAAALIRRRMGR